MKKKLCYAFKYYPHQTRPVFHGDKCIKLLKSFGTDGEKSFYIAYNAGKNRMTKKRNFKVSYVVLLKERDYQRNRWSLVKVIDVYTDKNGDVRSLMLFVTDVNYGSQTRRRLITKINSLATLAIRMSNDETLAFWEDPDEMAWYELLIIIIIVTWF